MPVPSAFDTAPPLTKGERRVFWLATPIVFALSAGWHWLYDLLPLPPVAWVAPVAESVWEHSKIVWYPTLVYWWCARRFLPRAKQRLLAATLFGWVSVGAMVALYYVFHAALGIGRVLAVDLMAEALGLGSASCCAAQLYRRVPATPTCNAACLTVWGAHMVLLAVCTYLPPDLPLFAAQ